MRLIPINAQMISDSVKITKELGAVTTKLGKNLLSKTQTAIEGTGKTLRSGFSTLMQSKVGKLVIGGGELLAKKGGKVIPVIGTGVGIGLAANEFSKGNYAAAFVEAVGASEIPVLAQVADIGSLVADLTWVAKDVFDSEQKIEQWWYKTFLK